MGTSKLSTMSSNSGDATKPKPKQHLLGFIPISGLAGGMAGATEIVITMPLDTVKTYMQINKVSNLREGAQQIITQKGVRGLYFGLPAMMLQVSFKAGIRFLAFENLKAILEGANPNGNATMTNLVAGLGAGFVEAMVWTAPTERIKILRQNDIRSKTPKYATFFGGIKTVLSEQGVAGFYKGVVPTTIRQASSVAVRFMLYKDLMARMTGGEKASVWQQLFAGSLTGVASTLLNNPIDVVKSRLQSQDGGVSKYRGTVHCLMETAKTEGVTALYRGTLPRMMKVSAGQAITFAAYEQFSALLRSVA